jgi:hypothetical protein
MQGRQVGQTRTRACPNQRPCGDKHMVSRLGSLPTDTDLACLNQSSYMARLEAGEYPVGETYKGSDLQRLMVSLLLPHLSQHLDRTSWSIYIRKSESLAGSAIHTRSTPFAIKTIAILHPRPGKDTAIRDEERRRPQHLGLRGLLPGPGHRPRRVDQHLDGS